MLSANFQLVTKNKSVIIVEANKVTRTSGTTGETKIVTDSSKRGELLEFGACFVGSNVPVGPDSEPLPLEATEWGAYIDENTVEPNVIKLGKCAYFKYASGLTYVCTIVISTTFPDANA